MKAEGINAPFESTRCGGCRFTSLEAPFTHKLASLQANVWQYPKSDRNRIQYFFRYQMLSVLKTIFFLKPILFDTQNTPNYETSPKIDAKPNTKLFRYWIRYIFMLTFLYRIFCDTNIFCYIEFKTIQKIKKVSKPQDSKLKGHTLLEAKLCWNDDFFY